MSSFDSEPPAAPPTPSWADAGTFVVIGASGGIGAAVCRQLEARGARLLLAARQPERFAEIGLGQPFRGVACDARESTQVDALFAHANGDQAPIAGVVHCVGSLLLKPAHLTTDDEWAEVLHQNLTTAFHVVRAAAKAMRRGGSIVLCSSAAATTGLANHDAIAAAKAGIEGLTRSAAATYASRKLRCNAVAPGLVRTPLSQAITANPRSLDASQAMHALGRIGEPDDVASAICWLLDPANSWVSGHVLRVDGGLADLRPVPRR